MIIFDRAQSCRIEEIHWPRPSFKPRAEPAESHIGSVSQRSMVRKLVATNDICHLHAIYRFNQLDTRILGLKFEHCSQSSSLHHVYDQGPASFQSTEITSYSITKRTKRIIICLLGGFFQGPSDFASSLIGLQSCTTTLYLAWW